MPAQRHDETRQVMTILYAEDDEEDRILTEAALRRSKLRSDLRFVQDGEELLMYLRRQPPYDEPGAAPLPNIILLDLNMPKMDGREALKEIKKHEHMRRIPIVVMTTSSEEADIHHSYDTGAASFITKPSTFDSLVKIVQTLGDYWAETVELPDG